MDRRRRKRQKLLLPVRVAAIDIKGKPLLELAQTFDLTQAGVRLSGLHSQITPFETLVLRHRSRQGRFRVVWTGPMPGGSEFQMGLECIEPSKDIWYLSEALQPEPRDACCEDKSRSLSIPEKRGLPRYQTNVGVELTALNADYHSWGWVTDISLNGCYCRTPNPLALLTSVRMKIYLEQAKLEVLGIVRTRDPLLGMGVEFTQVASPVDLAAFLDRVSSSRNPLAYLRTGGMTPAVQGFCGSLNSVSTTPPRVGSSAEQKPDAMLMVKRIEDAITQLQDIEALLKLADIDQAVKNAFCDAVGHLCSAAEPIQHRLTRR